MMMKQLMRSLLPLALALTSAAPAHAQQEIRLWQGKAPGSEDVTIPEKVVTDPNGRIRITDVSDPTLTVYLPDPAKATGTAVILAPGGGMRVLGSWRADTGPIKWFNDRGIAVFVLKYRLMLTGSPLLQLPMPQMTEIPRGNGNPFPNNAEYNAMLARAYADAQQAVRLVRRNATNWRVDPTKVGMMGYSAGGCVAFGALLLPSDDARPDFVISAYGPPMLDAVPPPNSPPVFLAVSQRHPNVALSLLAFYEEWTRAGGPGELHVFDQVGDSPFFPDTGDWLQSAYQWMGERGFAPPRAEH